MGWATSECWWEDAALSWSDACPLGKEEASVAGDREGLDAFPSEFQRALAALATRGVEEEEESVAGDRGWWDDAALS